MKKRILSIIFLATMSSFAQVGIGTSTPEGLLDLKSSTSGLVLPRVANTTVVVNPQGGTVANGTIVYDLSCNCLKAYQDSNWSIVIVDATPSGVISMWSGLITTIPSGYALCDGTNGTPDLRGRFIYGASIDAEVLTTGGSADAIVVGHDHTTPDHTHTASTDTGGEHTHAVNGVLNNGSFGPTGSAAYPAGTGTTGIAGSHSHAVTINNGGAGSTSTVGLSKTNANLPPYMYLAYIMKL